MNKARFEAIEAERLNDPLKFANAANIYWMEALPLLRFHFEPKEVLEKAPKAEVKKEEPKKEPKKAWKRKSS